MNRSCDRSPSPIFWAIHFQLNETYVNKNSFQNVITLKTTAQFDLVQQLHQ
jgi:hypothetical protein